MAALPSSSLAAPEPSAASAAAASSASGPFFGPACGAGLAFVRYRARIASIAARSRMAGRICSR